MIVAMKMPGTRVKLPEMEPASMAQPALSQPVLAQASAGPVGTLAPLGPTAALLVDDILLRRRLECVLDLAPDGDADVLVVDLPAGLTLIDTAVTPDMRCLVLSDDPALSADPTLPGVLPRAASARQIAAAVAAIAEGLRVRGTAFPATATRIPPNGGDAPATGASLTPRELEILGLVGGGMSNKAIARRLGISAHTVKYHLEAVFAKLGVRSRAEAATQGLRRGLVVL
ncbi:MAG TPA: response regulator transcription factor [Acetobacteraceae bacterium]|jgi:DNA-binding NarL/FixJ family response regulator